MKRLSKQHKYLSDAYFTVNQQWQITSCNDGAVKLLETDREELIGQRCEDVFCKDERFQPICETLRPIRDSVKVVDIKRSFPTADSGLKEVIQMRVVTLPNPQGGILGAYIGFADLSTPLNAHKLALDSITSGVFTVDHEKTITSFNHAAERLTGWTEAEVIGKPCSDIFQSSICGGSCALSCSIENGAETLNHEIFITRKDGKVVPVTISAAPLLDIDGNVLGGVETFQDITGRLQNELVLDSVADGVFAVDQEWKITSFNSAAEQMTGWKEEDVLGKPCREVFRSSVCGENCVLAKSIEMGQNIIDQDIFVLTEDGETLPVCISASPLLDNNGNVIGGVEIFRDNTTRLRNKLILDSIADGVFTVDRNWQITSFNRAAEVITGWSREEAIGKYCSDVFHSSICGRSCAIAESLYGGKPVANRSINIDTRSGKRLPVSISAAPLVDHEGNVVGGVETFRDLTVENILRKQLKKSYTFDEIISKSASMQRMFQIMPEIARSDSNVLVLGESGTGKELVAKALFNASTRNNAPFVIVNCGALPETLLESELFGYKAGAFTDARKDKKGRFAAAEGGTIFLDEIGEIPQALQVKLLRVLQYKVYEPLGANDPVHADVRIIAATNRDLKQQVEDGSFREDLFYRLNVVKINLPPLRERKEDIPLLIDHFVEKFGVEKAKDIVGVGDDALNLLMQYDYPGNIRELENIIEYAFILCPGGFIQEDHLPEPFTGENVENNNTAVISGAGQTLEEYEKKAIEAALERNQWKKMKTCRELDISKDTLRRKIKKYDLKDSRMEGLE